MAGNVKGIWNVQRENYLQAAEFGSGLSRRTDVAIRLGSVDFARTSSLWVRIEFLEAILPQMRKYAARNRLRFEKSCRCRAKEDWLEVLE